MMRHVVVFIVVISIFAPIRLHCLANNFLKQRQKRDYINYITPTGSPPWNETWYDRIKRHLLYKYDKFSRPTQHYNITTVELGLIILHAEMDDVRNTLTLNAWLRMKWHDDKLQWEPAEFGGLSKIHLGSHELWQPDIYVENSAIGANGVDHYRDTYNLVFYNGSVLWVPPANIRTICQLTFTYWPFEKNECSVHLTSWSYSGLQIDLQTSNISIDMSYYESNTEWNIEKSEAYRKISYCSGYPVPCISAVYKIGLSRNSQIYYHMIIAPTIPIVFFILSGFWIRPYSEIKLIINVCTLFASAQILIFLGSKVPAGIQSMPLIVRFYSSCMYQITISTILSLLMISISKRSFFRSSVPNFISSILMGNVGKYLGLNDIIQEIRLYKPPKIGPSPEVHADVVSPQAENSNKIDGNDDRHMKWILLATALDRLFCIVFCIVFSVMAIKCIRNDPAPFSNKTHFIK